MLFGERWRSLQDWNAQLRWWQHFVYLPLYAPVMALALACCFPKLATFGIAAVVITYGYNIYTGVYSLGDVLTKGVSLFVIVTAGSYMIVALSLLEEGVRSYFRSSAQESSKQDSNSTA
jgi:hypothetical protein